MTSQEFKPLWSSFAGFRKVLASALKKAKAPEQIVFEVGYIDCEDAGIAADCFEAYENTQYELESLKRLKKKDPTFPEGEKEAWEDIIDAYIHDCVIEICSSYSNLWNYAPGHKPEKVDSKKLAEKVVEILFEKLAEAPGGHASPPKP